MTKKTISLGDCKTNEEAEQKMRRCLEQHNADLLRALNSRALLGELAIDPADLADQREQLEADMESNLEECMQVFRQALIEMDAE